MQKKTVINIKKIGEGNKIIITIIDDLTMRID